MLEHDGIRCLCYGSRNVSERETCPSENVCEWKRVRVGTRSSGKCTDNTAANAANYAAANIIGALRCRKHLQEGSHIRTKKHSVKRCATKRHVRPYYLALTVLKTALINIVADILRA